MTAWAAYAGGRSRIFSASSDDDGRGWSDAVVADDTSPAIASDSTVVAHPNLAANASGHALLTWFDLQRKCWRARAAAALVRQPWNAGSVALTTCNAPSSSAEGDYSMVRQWETGLAVAADGRFWPVWMSSRDGAYAIWTTPITLREAVARNASR